MHRCPSRKIKNPPLVSPAVIVPCPGCNRIVNECCPRKDEKHARQHSSPFSCSANQKCRRESCKHALKKSKEQSGELVRLCCEHSSEHEIIKVPQETVARFRERQRVPPDKPLLLA